MPPKRPKVKLNSASLGRAVYLHEVPELPTPELLKLLQETKTAVNSINQQICSVLEENPGVGVATTSPEEARRRLAELRGACWRANQFARTAQETASRREAAPPPGDGPETPSLELLLAQQRVLNTHLRIAQIEANTRREAEKTTRTKLLQQNYYMRLHARTTHVLNELLDHLRTLKSPEEVTQLHREALNRAEIQFPNN